MREIVGGVKVILDRRCNMNKLLQTINKAHTCIPMLYTSRIDMTLQQEIRDIADE